MAVISHNVYYVNLYRHLEIGTSLVAECVSFPGTYFRLD